MTASPMLVSVTRTRLRSSSAWRWARRMASPRATMIEQVKRKVISPTKCGAVFTATR